MKKKLLGAALSVGLGLKCLPAFAADPSACQTVKFGDVGWSDAAVVNGVASNLLSGMGYKPKVTMVTLSVAYLSLQNRQLDVFLSDWEPSGASVIEPYMKTGKIERITKNLSGAHYTLAVPQYTADEGLKDFKDISVWAPKLNGTIYGIESGNDGNKIVLDMIKSNEFSLGKFHLNESSEQGMLAQVSRAVSEKKPVVFLAWEPHPMNTKFHIAYLTGGEKQFGASAEVNTIVGTGYTEKCPNVGRLLKQLVFTVPAENEMMTSLADSHQPAVKVAKEWLKTHTDVLDKWLDGVTTADGAPALPAVKAYLTK